MSFVADETFDANAFLKAARRLVRAKGSKDEDLPSEMLLQALEQREKAKGAILSMELIWRKAYERLHPRGSDGQGGLIRRDAMDHSVSDATVTEDGDEIRTTECAVLDFAAGYAAISSTRGLKSVARAARSDLRRARYLARLPYGHLPFIL